MATITDILDADQISASNEVINTNFDNLNSDKIETSYLDTDTTLAANSDSKIATQKATKTYVDANVNPTGRSWNEYAAANSGSDSYAIAPSGVTAYVTGQTFKFKADVANTGACTLNVNGLGAKTIKKDVTTDLATGDILANQLVTVTYDGTNMQLMDRSGLAEDADITTLSTRAIYTVGPLDNSLVKTYFNIQLPFTLWTGSTSGALTTDFANWVRSSTDAAVSPANAFTSFIGTGSDSIYASALTPDSAGYTWASTNKVILDFWAKLPASGTGDLFMGFGSQAASNGFIMPYTQINAGEDRAGFSLSSAGVLYATMGKNGTGITNTDISSGLTLTNYNNYRIELDLGNNVLFYVNGTLKATLSGANLYTGSNPVVIGFGRSNTTIFVVTAPTLSLEMNP